MLLATTKTLIHRSAAPLAAAKALKQPRMVLTVSKAFTSTTFGSSSSVPGTSSLVQPHPSNGRLGLPSKISVIAEPAAHHQQRFFSSAPPIQGIVSDSVSSDAETVKSKTGYVTKKLRVLDMDVVEKIKNELQSVDVNFDGR